MVLRATIGMLAVLVVSLALPGSVHAGFGRRGSSHPGSQGGRSFAPSHSRPASGGFGRGSSGRYSGSAGGRRGNGRRYQNQGGGYGYVPYLSPGYSVWGYGLGLSPFYPGSSYPGYAGLPPPAVMVDGQPVVVPSYAEPEPVAAAFSGDFMAGGIGPLFGLALSIEGQSLGVWLGYTAALAPIGDTGLYDTLHLAAGHLTFALLSSARARVRAEAGVHLAVAPEVTFLAPGAGLSTAIALVGPLGLEARVFGNVWPYTQLDARAGLTLAFGGLGFAAGARGLYLNDNGVLGAVNAGDTSDFFFGPYATLAFAL